MRSAKPGNHLKRSVIGERKCRLCLADVRGEKWMRDEQKQTLQDVCGEAMVDTVFFIY